MIQTIRSATIFSLSGDPPCALQDIDRLPADLDSAVLLHGDTRLPCALEKLSSAGAALRLDSAPESGTAMTLELADGQRFAGRIAWAREGEAGLLFDAPIDVVGALARNLAALPAERRAVPRVEIHQHASIRVAGRAERARTRNLSQGGAGIETRAALSPGDAVQLTIDGLRPLDGTVRWVRAGQAGVAFDEEIAWQVLMPWFRQAQQFPAAAVSAEADGMIAETHPIRLDAPAQVRSGVQWWNAQVRALTAQRVELETRAALMPGAQLWIKLPEIGGGPAAVIERAHGRLLCEFRLPLRPHELSLVTGRASR